MRRALPTLLGISLILFFSAVIFNKFQNVSAATATNLVISEVQIAGSSTTDEFIELYNPTDSDINLSSWKLGRKSQTGNPQTDLVASLSGIIKSHGYFLIASDNYTGAITPDVIYASASSSIASNNSITLYDNLSSQVDTLGFSTSTASETATVGNPAANRSVERKANSSSTASSMGIGGADEFMGNGEDTNNNSSDFVVRTTPQPQNSLSQTEPPETPSITPSTSPSPTITISPLPTVTVTTSPSPTVTVTTAPTTTPSFSPSPTLTPTITIPTTPTSTPTPTPSFSPTPPIPTPKVIFSGPKFTCSIHYRPLRFFNKTFFIPFTKCVGL